MKSEIPAIRQWLSSTVSETKDFIMYTIISQHLQLQEMKMEQAATTTAHSYSHLSGDYLPVIIIIITTFC